MSERMTVECGCERGGDCTRTTMCALDSALQDQADMYEAKLDAVKQIEDDCRERGFTETCWETIKRIREAIGEQDE